MKITTAMLADDALAANGKLYIHGGGWDSVMSATFPLVLPRFALVFVVEVDPLEFQTPHPITVRLVDQDHQEVGIRLEGVLQAAPPPSGSAGDSVYLSQVMRFEHQVRLPGPGAYRFLIERTEPTDLLASVPLRASARPTPKAG